VNPRLLDIQWPDTTAPTIRKILVEPASPESRINGDVFPVVLEVSKGGAAGDAANPILISGPVVIGVDVVDPANNGGTKLGVHRIETVSASMGSLFTVQHDRVSYDHDDDSIIAYHPGYMDEGRFLMQWHHPQNRAELYEHTSQDGVYRLADGEDTITVTARDFYKNQTQAFLSVKSDAWVESPAPLAKGNGQGDVFYDNVGEWLVVSAVFSTPEPTSPVLWVNNSVSDTTFMRISDTVFRAVYAPDGEINEIVLSVEHPRAGQVSPDSDNMVAHQFLVIRHGVEGPVGMVAGLKITANKDSVYGTLILTAGQTESRGAPGLESVGPAYQVWPDYGPVRAPLMLSFPLPLGAENFEGLSVYRAGKKSWGWVESRVVDERLTISTSTLGTFQIMRDTTPPQVKVRTLRDGDRLGSRPAISADVGDDGSGILSWEATWNGEWLLMEYDPEQKRIEWEQDEDLPTGPGELIVRIVDRAQRVTEKRVQVTIAAGTAN